MWDQERLRDGVGGSEWIASKVQVALSLDVLGELQVEGGVDRMECERLRRENEQLRERIGVFESRIFGVMDDRILGVMSGGWMSFDEVVQRMIDGEAEATFETLQKLAVSGMVEVDSSGNRWRVKA
ncbi:hypothetical protein DRN85_02940 [Methanosarcinales archaeon]|nr:MAG: hypothetical protein DRN85_02940 [Methanosarcinales archaeon]